jgi:HK97 family phage major capsid protein
MKSFLKPYRHLLALFSVAVLCFSLFLLGVPAFICGGIFACWQLSQFAMYRPRRGHCYTTALTPEQIKEFGDICKELGAFVPGLKDLSGVDGGFAAIKKLPELLKAEQGRVDGLEKEFKKLQKKHAMAGSEGRIRWVGGIPFLTDTAAKAVAADIILQASVTGNMLEKLISNEASRQKFLTEARGFAGIVEKAGGALSSGDIPLPTLYMPQVVELVFAYGQARQFATVYPLGAGTVKLPRLQAGEDSFAFLGAGTAGMSQQIGQKEVQATLVTFTANKVGGLIRIPTEIEEDTFIQLGQFLARYIARQFALIEDKTMFLADGTGTYANITGVGTYCVNNPAYLIKPAAGNTVVTDLNVNHFRALRGLVNPAVLANMAQTGTTNAAYYMHPSLESLLVTFNTIGSPQIYIPARNGQPATLDGWPIHWIGISAANTGNAQPNALVAFFGDLSYWYLGERGQPRVEVSREVFFATDELAMRGLERIDVEAMAVDAMATLQLPPA